MASSSFGKLSSPKLLAHFRQQTAIIGTHMHDPGGDLPGYHPVHPVLHGLEEAQVFQANKIENNLNTQPPRAAEYSTSTTMPDQCPADVFLRPLPPSASAESGRSTLEVRGSRLAGCPSDRRERLNRFVSALSWLLRWLHMLPPVDFQMAQEAPLRMK